jgi:hypothetical protein
MKTKILGFAVLSSTLLVGCGGSPAANTNTAAGNSAAPKNAAAPTTTTVNTPSGPATASTGSLPADFPKDVPVYPGATIVSASNVGGTSGAVLSTADEGDKVAAYYKDELAKQGWSSPQAMNAGGTNVVRATKEKRQVAVSITKGADGKTSVSLGITAMP